MRVCANLPLAGRDVRLGPVPRPRESGDLSGSHSARSAELDHNQELWLQRCRGSICIHIRLYREGPAADITARGHVPPSIGGRGYFPRPWTGMAQSQFRPCQPRATQGDVGNRELPYGSSRRPCRALRGLRLYDNCLQLLPLWADPVMGSWRRADRVFEQVATSPLSIMKCA